MTDTPPDPILDLAEQVGRLATSVEAQSSSLNEATSAMRRTRRESRLLIATMALVVIMAIGGFVTYSVQRSDREAERVRASCERGNEIRAANIVTARVTVLSAGIELGLDRSEAQALADSVSAQVAQDPGLQPRDC